MITTLCRSRPHWWSVQRNWFSSTSKTTSLSAWTLISMRSEPTDPQRVPSPLSSSQSEHTFKSAAASEGCFVDFSSAFISLTQEADWKPPSQADPRESRWTVAPPLRVVCSSPSCSHFTPPDIKTVWSMRMTPPSRATLHQQQNNESLYWEEINNLAEWCTDNTQRSLSLAKDTEMSASLRPDNRAASFLRLLFILYTPLLQIVSLFLLFCVMKHKGTLVFQLWCCKMIKKVTL